jgi:hypothetical protein
MGSNGIFEKSRHKKLYSSFKCCPNASKKKILEAPIIVLEIVHFGNKQWMGSGVN